MRIERPEDLSVSVVAGPVEVGVGVEVGVEVGVGLEVVVEVRASGCEADGASNGGVGAEP
jgi:hypothetical protein